MCINASCTINWEASESTHGYAVISYIVIWINLHTKDIYNYTVPGNTHHYIITDLSINVMYDVNVTAEFMCGGSVTSDNVPINGECGCC